MALTPLQLQLMIAIINGEDISDTLNQFENANDKVFTDRFQNTPLHLACMMRNEALIKLLLENGFDYALRVKNNQCFTPLHILCIKDSQSLMPKSKKNNENRAIQLSELKTQENNNNNNNNVGESLVNDELEDNIDDFNIAVTIRCIKLLLEHNDKIEAPIRDNIKKIKEFQQENPNLANKINKISLPESLQEIFTSSLSSLNSRHTPLHLACENFADNIDVITTLLWNDPQRIYSMLIQESHLNETPFHIICKFGTIEVITLLFKSLLDSRQALMTARKHNVTMDDSFQIGMIGGAGVPIGGGLLLLLGGVGMSFLLPPVGIGMVVAAAPVVLAALPGMFVGAGIGIGVGAILGREFNPMQIIAEYNTAEVMREFCKQMPADLLTHYYNDKEPFTQPVYKMVAARYLNNKGQNYSLSPQEFHQLVSQQVCFQRGLDYFVKKFETFDKKPENVNARMNDFCAFIKLYTEFFMQNKDTNLTKEALENQLKNYILGYVNSEAGQQAVFNINRTKSTFFGRASVLGIKVSDDLYNSYRAFLQTVDVTTLCYRHNELCMKVFTPLDEANYKYKKQEYQATRQAFERIQKAFKAGGYEPNVGQANNNEIIIPDSNNNNNNNLSGLAPHN